MILTTKQVANLKLRPATRTQLSSADQDRAPITSQNFSSNFGSFENLNVLVICGFKSFFAQMRCTVLGEMPTWRPMLRTLQRFRPFGGRVASVMTRATLASGKDGLRPWPPLSARPSGAVLIRTAFLAN